MEQVSSPVETPSVPVAPPPPAEPRVAEASTVIVPSSGGVVPKWFYFIFGATLIVFLVVTTLLVLQLTQKPQAPGAVPTITPQATSKAPTPTTSANLATDAAVLKLNKIGTSDELSSIEADLKDTDLGVWDQGLNVVEASLSNPF